MANRKMKVMILAVACMAGITACGSRTEHRSAFPTVAPTKPPQVMVETQGSTEAAEPVIIATEAETETKIQTEELTEAATAPTAPTIPMLTYPVPSEVTYINGILVVNKTYGLPADYNPGENPEARAAFDRMAAGAAAEGLNIFVASGFRSYDHQMRTYSRYVYYDGQENADTYSARPGFSEHQTGLAFDMNSVDDSFAGTPEALWVEAHCYEYGFIIRYPKGKEDITGYQYEPWHVRYLGIDTAADVYNSGLTLEEYLGIDSKYQE